MLHLSSAVSQSHKQLRGAISGTRSYTASPIFNNMRFIRDCRHHSTLVQT